MSTAQQNDCVGASQATASTFLQPEQNASALAASQCSLQFEAIYKCSCGMICLHLFVHNTRKRLPLEMCQLHWLLNGLRRSQGMCQDSFSFKEQLPPIAQLQHSWMISECPLLSEFIELEPRKPLRQLSCSLNRMHRPLRLHSACVYGLKLSTNVLVA